MKKANLIVKNRQIVAEVDPQDIMYVLKDNRRLIVATQYGEYVYSAKMSAAEEVCLEGFYQPVGRCIVNLSYLRSVDVSRRRLTFKNGDEISLGRDACSKTKGTFHKYLMEEREDPEASLAAEEEAEYEEWNSSEKGLATSVAKL